MIFDQNFAKDFEKFLLCQGARMQKLFLMYT